MHELTGERGRPSTWSPPDHQGPLFCVPATDAERHAPAQWVAANLLALRAALTQRGCVVLRGFAIESPETFAEVATLVGGPLGHDYEGPSPRVGVASGVYTASEVPSALVIPEHAEMSYLPRMARHLFFWCRQPAKRGGETTVVDGRRVLAGLEQARVAPLLEAPLRVRRRHASRDSRRDPFELKPWQELFSTDDRWEAQWRAESLGFGASFDHHQALTLISEQPALRRHPHTQELAWLNHLLVFHASTPAALLASAFRHERELRALALYPLAWGYRQAARRLGRDVASDVQLSDGTAIPDDTVAHVREVVDREATRLVWQRGDLAILDNHLVLHGRRPYRGDRKLVVAWSEARA